MSARDDTIPAFPSTNNVRVGEYVTGGHPGMSLRAYFAARAPTEIPDWFIMPADQLPSRVLAIHRDVALEQQCGFATLPEDDKRTLREWLRDGVWDLPERLELIGHGAAAMLEVNRAEVIASEADRRAAVYFAWRWHYADMMVKAGGKC